MRDNHVALSVYDSLRAVDAGPLLAYSFREKRLPVFEVFHSYAVVNLIAFPMAAVAFGLYYAKREGKNRGFGVAIGLAATLVCVLLSLIGEVMVFWGLVVYASFYLADCKNRSRLAWTIAALVFATPVVVVLLLLPALPLGSLSILEREDGDFR